VCIGSRGVPALLPSLHKCGAHSSSVANSNASMMTAQMGKCTNPITCFQPDWPGCGRWRHLSRSAPQSPPERGTLQVHGNNRFGQGMLHHTALCKALQLPMQSLQPQTWLTLGGIAGGRGLRSSRYTGGGKRFEVPADQRWHFGQVLLSIQASRRPCTHSWQVPGPSAAMAMRKWPGWGLAVGLLSLSQSSPQLFCGEQECMVGNGLSCMVVCSAGEAQYRKRVSPSACLDDPERQLPRRHVEPSGEHRMVGLPIVALVGPSVDAAAKVLEGLVSPVADHSGLSGHCLRRRPR